MNICVIGGGGPTGKFGRDFCDRARAEGHNVYVLSHQDYHQGDPKQVWANFDNVNLVIDTFKQLTADIDCIDIFVYNSNPQPCRPSLERDFKSNSKIAETQWNDTITKHATIPHLLCIEALKKMSTNSKIVFLISGLAIDYDRVDNVETVGYATGKAAQVFLMMAFAHCNDRGAIATAIAPHFDYDDVETYKSTFNSAYQYITDIDQKQNGKILRLSWNRIKKLMKIGKPINRNINGII